MGEYMSDFHVEIVERPEIVTAGVKVATTMEKCGVDCPALWEKNFGPRMADFPADPRYPNQSFGVSVMIDQSAFDYWAVMPLREGAAIPTGMEKLVLAGGSYAECRLNGLAELGDAYNYVYLKWAAAQEKFVLNMAEASIELYTSEFMTTGKLVIYCPLAAKQS